jgi:hypothetical protein
VSDLDRLREQRQLAVEKLKVREEMRSNDFDEDSQVIQQRALQNVQQGQQPNGLWQTMVNLIRQVPAGHKVVVVLPVVLFVLYVLGWQLGIW